MTIWQATQDHRQVGRIDDHQVTLVPNDIEQGIVVSDSTTTSDVVLALHDPERRALPPLADFYVREGELVADYPQGEGFEYGFQLRWELHASPYGPLLSLTISMQTNLLDCHPTLDLRIGSRIASQPSHVDLPARALLPLAAHPGLILLQGPRDFPFNSLKQEESDAAFIRVFDEFMEKGVIRKSRLWLALDAGAADKAALYEHIANQPLPLTA